MDDNKQQLHDAHIFIVDDDLVNLKLLKKILQRAGYCNLKLINSSLDVFEQYQKCKPSLIILDLNMPQMDGFELLKKFKALNDPMLPPILVLTAQNDREHRLRSLEMGARDFISKPFDQQELLVRVRNSLEVHLAHCYIQDQKLNLDLEVRKKTAELRHTRLQMIRRLGQASEFRDNETGYHIVRMSLYSEIIAKEMGWSSEQCELMLHASPMHDLGKIGIADNILLKPGRLDADEFEIIKTHPQIGADLLADDDSELMVLAHSIALTHHEKWDGSGYPNGLSGVDIPEAGRIVAVADVFDALTSVRPYKKVWSIEDATSFIQNGSGAHFDPTVVSAFLKSLPTILATKGQYIDKVSP